MALLLWQDNGDIPCTTTLSILDCGTALGALGPVLALGAIRHVVVELEVDIKLDRDIKMTNRELLNILAASAAEAGSTTTLGDAASSPPSKGPSSQAITLLQAACLALETREVKSAIVRENPFGKVCPVKAIFLLNVASFNGITRTAEG